MNQLIWTLERPLAALGRGATSVARHAGQMATLLWQIVGAVAGGRVSPHETLNQAYQMGVQSVPLVIVTAMLTGVVTSQQGGYQFNSSASAIPKYILGSVVSSSVILELGPVMTAFVLIGRVGARITAELGTMRVSEQIDAIYALGRDPVRVLAAPRLLAGLLTMPVLVAIADVVGFASGMLAARTTLALGSEAFIYGARLFWHNWDLFYSLLKSAVFGFVIPFVSVHMGLLTEGGAEGVGRTTTASVVFMILSVLVLDALFPPLLLG
jgi:phospholipid/cholesterol/gamma-HCH transport system permease protein